MHITLSVDYPMCVFAHFLMWLFWNNLAAVTQGTDGLCVPQCPRFRQVQRTHTVLKGRDNTHATLAMTNCYTPIHNKYTSLKYISENFRHGKIYSVPIPRAKKELLDAQRYWLSEIVSLYFVSESIPRVLCFEMTKNPTCRHLDENN